MCVFNLYGGKEMAAMGIISHSFRWISCVSNNDERVETEATVRGIEESCTGFPVLPLFQNMVFRTNPELTGCHRRVTMPTK